MKELFDQVAFKTSKLTALSYSTSFSMGIRLFDRKYREPIYAVYGFVRFADEIVDTLTGYDREKLFYEFKDDTYRALKERISTNPILQSFQQVVHKYRIEEQLIEQFLKSMEMDLFERKYDRSSFDEYVLGSAEVVGLMCLRIFLEGDEERYQSLRPYAMKLGAAFQKINFLRDLRADYYHLGRSYFPGVQLEDFSDKEKMRLEKEIEDDFAEAYKGIELLPRDVRFGVYLAYIYYYKLFRKIRRSPASMIMEKRFRISDARKYLLFTGSYVKFRLGLI